MLARSGIRRIAPWFLGAALAAALGCSEESPVDPNAKMREIYYLSALPGEVRPVPSYVEQALGQQTGEFAPEQFEIAREVVKREINAKKLERAVLDRLADQPQREYVDQALEWLKTPVVQKFMQAMVSTWSPAGMLEMKTYAENLKDNPQSDERRSLIERFDTATNSSGVAAETMLLSAYAVAVMHDTLKPPGERLGPAALRESMISQRPVLKPIFKETSSFALGFAFREFDDREVERIVEFAESEPGKWLYGTTSSNFLNALLEITANIGGIYTLALPAQPES